MNSSTFLGYAVFVLISTSILFVSGCGDKQEVVEVDEVRPVKTILVSSPNVTQKRNFPAQIDANKKAELSFRVSGKVNELLVKEGEIVTTGQVIAKLDQVDFKIALDDKDALFTRAKKDYERGKILVKDGNISKRDFDGLEANFRSRRADLKLAEQQLSYTTIVAPFDGIIAQRHIQKFEEVQAKESIVTLNSIDFVDIIFHLPENMIKPLKTLNNTSEKHTSKAVKAIFGPLPEEQFWLKFKEVATKADPQTQTFKVTFTMPSPKNMSVLPGMSTSVLVDLSEETETEEKHNIFYLPVSAVIADAKLKGTVWIVNDNNLVNPRSVSVGEMKGNSIQILDGISLGERIVIAGVPFLYDGLKVTLMRQSEQAIDNIQQQQPKKQQSVIKNNSSSKG